MFYSESKSGMSCHKLELEAIISNKNVMSRHTAKTILLDPNDKSADPKTRPGPLDSIFYSEIHPMAWFSIDNVEFNASKTSYVPPPGYDYLLSSAVTAVLPAISVKDKFRDQYQIAWCKNVMNEIIDDLTLKVDTYITLGKIDHHWLNIEQKVYGTLGFDDEYNRGQGNIPQLQTFASFLPNHHLRRDLPLFYCDSPDLAMPLFLLNSQASFSHICNFHLDIKKLLMMKKLVKDNWVKIKPILKVLNGVPEKDNLDDPKMIGEMVVIGDKEREWNKCQREEFTYYINEIVALGDDAEPVGFGSSPSVSLSSTIPTSDIFYVAHNVTAEQMYNMRARYGIIESGETPIYKTNLKYNNEDKIKDASNCRIASAYKNHYDRAPSPDMLAISFTHKSCNRHGLNVGVNLGGLGAMLRCSLQDPEHAKWLNNESDVRGESEDYTQTEAQKFRLLVRLRLQRKLVIEKGLLAHVD